MQRLFREKYIPKQPLNKFFEEVKEEPFFKKFLLARLLSSSAAAPDDKTRDDEGKRDGENEQGASHQRSARGDDQNGIIHRNGSHRLENGLAGSTQTDLLSCFFM